MSESVQIPPEALAIMRRLRDTAAVEAAVCQVMDTENLLTAAYIQQNMLSGPGKHDLGTLAVVTGLLRRSVRAMKAQARSGVVLSGIGTNVRYGAAHEFGVHETVQVKEHQRRNSILDRFSVSGEEVDRFTALRAGALSNKQASQAVRDSGKYVFAKKSAKQTVTGGAVTIAAHTMRMNLPARRMFTRGIEYRLPLYGKAISERILATWGQN